MTFDQQTARDLAAAVAFPSDRNRASVPPPWAVKSRRVTVPVVVVPVPAVWTHELVADALGVDAPTEHTDGDEWRRHAPCLGIDADVFFPQRGEDVGSARRVCAGCPVKVQCLTFALNENEHYGIWGGLSERQRRQLRRGRRVDLTARPRGPLPGFKARRSA